MQFTDAELRMIRWLRRQHEGWRGVRVIILGCSLASLAYAIWLAFVRRFDFEAGFFFIVSGWGLSYTLGSWSGRPEVSLLLKLIEANDPDRKSTD